MAFRNILLAFYKNMSRISSVQVVPEFQVVLTIDYDDGRMYPLTEDCPKCLLPVANRKLLSYQLDMLNKSGALGIRMIVNAIEI